MKKNLLIVVALLALFISLPVIAQVNPKSEPKTVVASKVNVYYFHFSRRCKTCVAVESNSKLALEQLYPAQVKSGDYVFTEVNLEEADGKALAQKMGVGGQSLLVTSGSNKVDVTSKGFMNANNLDKMKEEMKKAVDKVTKK